MAGIVRFVGVLGLVIVYTACPLGPQGYGQEYPRTGMTLYARHATEGDGMVKSPDGAKLVTVKRGEGSNGADSLHTSIIVQAGAKRFVARLDGFRSEVLWSPASNAFAVNQTLGGGGIGQRTYVFYVEGGQLRQVRVSPAVEKTFGSPVKCEVAVPPNTAVVQGLDAQRVLVVAEVVHVSVCKCLGTFMSYEVSLPQPEVLKSYTQAETKRLFADSLGIELKDADDACAKRWQKPRASSGAKAFSIER